ncbi:MAG: ClpXP protease specificity-enhancing factor SspB [Myxococcales bacterium]|jgi:stringent starvation protein B
MDRRSREKMQRLEEALERGVVMLHLDARRPGVVVPEQFRQDFQLRLNFSYRFDPPDLTVGEWGVRETLSFRSQRFKVAIPWSAIFAITSNVQPETAWLYPEDMPEELLEAAARSHGLTGEEIDELKREASETPVLTIVPPEPRAEPKRFVPRLVKLEDELPPEPAPRVVIASEEEPPRPTPSVVASEEPPAPPEPGAEPAGAPEPAQADEQNKAARRAHLRLIK